MTETRPPLLDRLAEFVRATSPAGWQRLDVAFAVAIFVGLTTPALLGFPSHEGSAWAVVLYGAATSLPLAVRRRWPLAALVVIVAAGAIGTAAGVRFTPFVSNAGPGVALAMYTVAERFGRRVSLNSLAGAIVVAFVSTGIAFSAHPDQDHNAVQVIGVLIGWCLGDMMRARRAYQDELAARRRDEADERARRGVVEERLRISREVHDVVSHNLSVIAVQSGVGRLVFDDQPEQARTALVVIEKLSRGALDDLRLLLNSSLAPAPGLDDLPRLIERMAATGMDVRLDVVGDAAKLPSMLELSAYRIVQEALTNVVKHANGAATVVTLRHAPDALFVEVQDEGWVPLTRAVAVKRLHSGGRGIAGMRERAALFGGEVVTEREQAGGFRVVARLPLGSRQ